MSGLTDRQTELRDAVKARIHGTGTAQQKGLNSLDCEVLALHAIDAIVGAGGRIVWAHDSWPGDNGGLCMLVDEEWKR